MYVYYVFNLLNVVRGGCGESVKVWQWDDQEFCEEAMDECQKGNLNPRKNSECAMTHKKKGKKNFIS